MAALEEAGGGSAEGVEAFPTTRLLLRNRQGVSLLHGPLADKNMEDTVAAASVAPDGSFAPLLGASLCEFSPSGEVVAVASATAGVVLHSSVAATDVEPQPPVVLEGCGRVQKLAFSPQGTYVVTWQKYEAEAEVQNLRVFEAATGSLVTSFPMKKLSSMLWPALQWTSDEALCMRMVSNEVHVFHGRELSRGVVDKIRSPNVAAFSVSPAATLPIKVCLFTPETKGKPANVRICQFPNSERAIASKTFFNAQEITFNWAPNGSAVLVKTHTDVDRTGASYYGSTGLHILHSDGSYDSSVSTQKEGPISDAKFSPTGRHFVVVAGSMPAVATLFDMRANAVFSFGTAHRNTICFSPHGRFLCLAGFGNLAGDMDFWDVNKQKKMGSNTAHCAVGFGWSPDSRFFMTATLAPRMNVDNGVKIFRYNGAGPIFELPQTQLFDAKWRPALPGVYPDRPQSPTRRNENQGKGSQAAAAAAKPQAYRPPRSSGALAAMMRAERAGETGGSGAAKLSAAAASRPKHLPVGMAPPAPAKISKSKAKKDKQKKKKEAEEAAALMQKLDLLNGDGGHDAAGDEPSAAAGANATKGGGSGAAAADAVEQPPDKEKRLKKLRKALKAIDAIKEKVAAGQDVNTDQKAKLDTEDTVKAEIAELEQELAAAGA
uniref:Eukaryotic translation initiation factor 2A n=1 Tax=Rhizochromulina marina TaxID=1034831 RepID=A0A7S2W6T5_9STRA